MLDLTDAEEPSITSSSVSSHSLSASSSSDSLSNTDDLVSCGFCSLQGFRETMEDRLCIRFNRYKNNQMLSFFSVFDGHCGDKCAEFCAKNLYADLMDALSTRTEDIPENEDAVLHNLRHNDKLIIDTMIRSDESFYQLMKQEEEMRKKVDKRLSLLKDTSGSTALATFIISGPSADGSIQHEIIVVNVGDSRCILFDAGRISPLSYDHRAYTPAEEERIYKAGAFVSKGRLFGQIAVSRSFGDFHYKQRDVELSKQAMIVIPDIGRVTLKSPPTIPTVTSFPSPRSSATANSSTQFLVLASDGLYDVMSNEEVAKFVADDIAAKLKKENKSSPDGKMRLSGAQLEATSMNLGQYCITELDSADNTTIIVVMLNG